MRRILILLTLAAAIGGATACSDDNTNTSGNSVAPANSAPITNANTSASPAATNTAATPTPATNTSTAADDDYQGDMTGSMNPMTPTGNMSNVRPPATPTPEKR